MENLDNELLGEINRKIARYKLFKSSRLNPKSLEEIKGMEINWIKLACSSEGYEVREYLDKYLRGIE